MKNSEAPETLTLEKIREELLDAKRTLAELNEQKLSLLRSRRLWYFTPSPKQEAFFENCDKKRRAGFCGNRFGKSTIGVIEDICWLIGYRPFYPEGHPLRYKNIPKHGVKGVVIAEDLDKVKEIFTNDESIDRPGKFFEYLPEGWFTTKKNEKGVIVQITVTSELHGQRRQSTVHFDTVQAFKKNPASFESGDWDFIHLDEPVMKPLWTALSRGLIDRGGYSWWLLTPIKEPWMFNDSVTLSKDQPNLYWYFEATMDDNPTLSEEDKKLYLDQLPDDEKEARRTGKPLAHVRLVYGDYDPDVHDFEGQLKGWNGATPPVENMVAYAIDMHPQTPHAVLFVSISPTGEIDFFDEIWLRGRTYELAEAIKAKTHNVRLGYELCEPAAWNTDQGSGVCHADTLYELGLNVVPASKRKEHATMLAQQLLKQSKQGKRVVRIHKRCTVFRQELITNYFDKDNKPEDKDDHLLECFRRLVIHDNLKYINMHFTEPPASYSDEAGLSVGDLDTDADISPESLSLTNF